ncbi:hypothetical protein BGZ57DRAFT_910295 [Hyaloscypha finlandica]|nr:hypothetical protein BGZ57DRAFT_910295 [Hyaloscypha finlandica]
MRTTLCIWTLPVSHVIPTRAQFLKCYPPTSSSFSFGITEAGISGSSQMPAHRWLLNQQDVDRPSGERLPSPHGDPSPCRRMCTVFISTVLTALRGCS